MSLTQYRIGLLTQDWALQLGLNTWYSAKTGSTNEVAKEQCGHRKERFILFIADHQDAGKGRGERKWQSPPTGSALLSSLLYTVDSYPQHLTSPLFGLALFRAVREVYPLFRWSLKAPNDLYIGEKKVAGLLIEVVDTGVHRKIIVGLGLNVLGSPKEVEIASSMAEQGRWIDFDLTKWTQFLDQLMAEFRLAVDRCSATELSATECKELVKALGQNPLFSNHVKDVKPNGDLVTDQGTIPWSSL